MTIHELSDKIWTTKNSRFSAYRRMKRSNISSMVATALLSSSIIAINLMVFLPRNQSDTIFTAYVTVMTIILSIFVLVMSLIISQLNYAQKRDNYHNCGVELTHLNDQLKAESDRMPYDEVTEETHKIVVDYLDKYHNILLRYNLNHTDFDYHYSCITEQGNKRNCILRFWFKLRWYIFDWYLFYILLSIASLAAVVLLLYFS